MTTPIPTTELFTACQTLFGSHVDISLNFLFYLQPSGAKSAYRKKALETHPDLIGTSDPRLMQSCTEQFRSVAESYELIRRFFEQRDTGIWRPPQNARHTYYSKQRRESTTPHAPNTPHHFHTGPLPQRPLALGRYLYYRGKIPYDSLLDALNWQRSQRLTLGKLARKWGWLDDNEVFTILRTTQFQGLFGEKAVRLGLLTNYQVKLLLFEQRSRHTRLGQYFAKKGILSPQTLAIMLEEQKNHNLHAQPRPGGYSHPEKSSFPS